MYPVLFKIPIFGGVNIYSYGVLVALGFVVGIIWINSESKRVGQDPAKAMDLLFYVILSGIIGSRILDVIVSERDQFLADPLMLFKIWKGGLVFYGGFIAAVITAFWYVRKHKMPFLVMVDIFTPALAIGHAIGRLGCFMAGCCYGKVLTHEAWYAVTFPKVPLGFAPEGIPLYPTQLIEAVGELVIFAFLAVLSRFKKFNGQIIATYMIVYAIFRLMIEFIRGDVERGFVIDQVLSTSQFIAIILLALGIAFYIKLWPRKGE